MTDLWTECECCGDFWCTLHEKHAYDCECPTIDDFAGAALDPYGERTPELDAWVVSHPFQEEEDRED